MANNTALVKSILYKSLAEGVYKDVVTRTASFYYFLGKTLSWEDDVYPPKPIDSYSYERSVRNEIITLKEIKPSDVAFVIPRKNWSSALVYDMYDDQYSDELIGINIISGGSGYIDIYQITVTIEGGGGTGAEAFVTQLSEGEIAEITVTNRGSGYTSPPTITISSPSGSGATVVPTMGIAYSGAQRLEDSNFYVVTDDYNVYKCLDNNNNARSTIKPTGSQLEPIYTDDGYVWKFMYNIPINLRNKFYTDEYIPVVSALTNNFYSNGTVDNIFISNRGTGYTTAVVSVTGDGYKESDPIYILSATVAAAGSQYTNPVIDFTPPFGTASPISLSAKVDLGQVLYNPDTWDYYEVVTPGYTAEYLPSHRYGTVINGTAGLKFIGTKITGSVTVTNPQNIIAVEVTNPGSGYITEPTVTVTDNPPEGETAGAGAVLTAQVGTSTVINTLKVSGGSNYSQPSVNVYGGGGVGCEMVAILNTDTGAIDSIEILNEGSGYTSVPSIIITDPTGGGAEYTAVLSGSGVTGITIVSSGNGYWDPVITIEQAGGVQAQASATVETGVINSVSLNGSIREVVIVNSGSGYTYPPKINFSGGGGNYAVAKSKIYADKVTTTFVVDPGNNYTSAPTVTFGDPWVYLDEVYTNYQFYTYTNLFNVIQAGIFGSTKPKPSTENPDAILYTSEMWVANTLFADTVGDTDSIHGDFEEPDRQKTLYYGNNLYAISFADSETHEGYTGDTAPTHTTGTEINGDLELTYIGTVATVQRAGTVAQGYAVLRYGAGYSATPVAIFDDTTGHDAEIAFFTAKSEAQISAVTENGQIVYLIINDPGVGYTKAALSVSGNGIGASLQADLSLGAISSQQANNEILTPAGTIDAIAIVSGGYSYGVANITITGDGTGAEAIAEIDPVTNKIIKVHITNRGEGYTYANVAIIGNGNGAQLRAIIAPYGGHGKNSPEELYAKSLMFYSNISTDLNQGVEVANDYRQVGIIRNPRVFDGYEKFQGSIGSACYIIQAPFDTDKFSKDVDVYIERVTQPPIEWVPSLSMKVGDFIFYEDRIYSVIVSGIGSSDAPISVSGSEINGLAVIQYVGSTKAKKRYRIVSINSESALIQSLDNDEPRVNDTFIKVTNREDTFTALSIGYPTVDKYSGQLMYIDNKQGFTPSADETITLRTIIKF